MNEYQNNFEGLGFFIITGKEPREAMDNAEILLQDISSVIGIPLK